MVRADHEHGTRREHGASASHDVVHAHVRLLHLAGEAGCLHRVVEGVARVEQSPPEVSDPIRKIIDLDVQPIFPFLEKVIHHLFLLPDREVHVLQEEMLVPEPGAGSPGIDGPPQRLEQSQPAQERRRVSLRVGERNRLESRVEVDGRQVKLNVRSHRNQLEARDAPDPVHMIYEPVDGKCQHEPAERLSQLLETECRYQRREQRAGTGRSRSALCQRATDRRWSIASRQ